MRPNESENRNERTSGWARTGWMDMDIDRVDVAMAFLGSLEDITWILVLACSYLNGQNRGCFVWTGHTVADGMGDN